MFKMKKETHDEILTVMKATIGAVAALGGYMVISRFTKAYKPADINKIANICYTVGAACLCSAGAYAASGQAERIITEWDRICTGGNLMELED